jgi:outer membrane protein assembly factor BamB
MFLERRLFATVVFSVVVILATGISLTKADPAPKDSPNEAGMAPLPPALWRKSLIQSKQDHPDFTRWIDAAEREQRLRGEPALSSFFPSVVQASITDNTTGKSKQASRLIYRSHRGIHAVDIETGALKWESEADPSYDDVGASHSPAPQEWLGFYIGTGKRIKGSRPGIFFENTNVGSPYADDKLVYAVKDLQIPSPGMPDSANGEDVEQIYNQWRGVGGDFRRNTLSAWGIATGKLRLELGRSRWQPELASYIFLGPPLAVDHKLYVLALKRTKLSEAVALFCSLHGVIPRGAIYWRTELLCIDPRGTAELIARYPLFMSPGGPDFPVGRRLRATHLAVVRDTLLCPTDGGLLIGFDIRAGKREWAYDYREKPEKRGGKAVATPENEVEIADAILAPWWSVSPKWKASSLFVSGDKVVFTAADSRYVHCVDARTGRVIWKTQQNDGDLYLAGVAADSAYIVGKKSMRSLRLDSGKTQWETGTGMPSGQGVMRDGTYYLPQRADAAGHGGEIRAIDTTTGRVVARYQCPDKHPPGNLSVFGERLVSQSTLEIAVHPLPQLKARP